LVVLLTRPTSQPAARTLSSVDKVVSGTAASRPSIISRRSAAALATCSALGRPPTRRASVPTMVIGSPMPPASRSGQVSLQIRRYASGSTPRTSAIRRSTRSRRPSAPPGTSVLNRSNRTARRMRSLYRQVTTASGDGVVGRRPVWTVGRRWPVHADRVPGSRPGDRGEGGTGEPHQVVRSQLHLPPAAAGADQDGGEAAGGGVHDGR